MAHYLIPASLNESSQAGMRRVKRARTPTMNPKELTFSQLMAHYVATIPTTETASKANMRSALNQFLDERGIPESAAIGSALRIMYYKNRDGHLEALRRQGRSVAYVANRKSYLGRWHAHLASLDRAHAAAAGTRTPLQVTLREVIGKSQVKHVARSCGVPLASLNRWLSGSGIRRESLRHLGKIERFFGLADGFLTALVIDDRAPMHERVAPRKLTIEYRKRLRDQSSRAYGITVFTPTFQAQWADFLRYKTADYVLGKERYRHGQWRATREHAAQHLDRKWYARTPDGRYVATASVVWYQTSQYLGWMCLPSEKGGLGLDPQSVQSLSCYADLDKLVQYTEWRRARAGDHAHAGVLSLLVLAKSLCHPTMGYLTQTPSIGAALGMNANEWVAHCTAAHAGLLKVHGALAGKMTVSRDPFEPIASILALPNPLDAVADAVARMDAHRPTTGGTSEAVWARDRLLVKLLASNPLRAKNLKLLTFEKDNTGNLRQDADGTWRIVLPRQVFKNATGAAKHREYSMPVNKAVWPDIERYLKCYRPMLAAEGNNRVFVSREDPGGIMHSLHRRFFALTVRYFDCEGFGPHAMRHIVATTILKLSPNNWTTAALVLHDQEATVRQHYAKLFPEDGAKWLDSIAGSAFARM